MLLASSFHELRPYLTIVPSRELADFAQAKVRFGDLDAALKRCGFGRLIGIRAMSS